MPIIKVLLATKDNDYYNRVSTYFAKYHEDVNFILANSADNVRAVQNKYQIALIDEIFSKENIDLPQNAQIVYLFETVPQNEQRPSTEKYVGAEQLYRMILSMYAEVAAPSESRSANGLVTAFVGAAGGVGTTTLAAAYAYRMSELGKKVLFITCDGFSDISELMNDPAGGGNMGKLIPLTERTSGNLALKAHSAMKTDGSGVMFVEKCDKPYDFYSLDYDKFNKVIDIACAADDFDCVVLDCPLNDERCRRFILEKASRVFVITDETAKGLAQLENVLSFFSWMTDVGEKSDIADRALAVINKATGAYPNSEKSGIRVIGSVMRHKDNSRNIAMAAAKLDMWNIV